MDSKKSEKMNNDKPLFSILIANYNNGKFIEDAIKSIINQTYENIEIIFIDDYFTDNSIKEIQNFDLNNLSIFKNDKNYGWIYQKNH